MIIPRIAENRLSNVQRTQRMTQHFWNRWRKEYIHHLQVRNKWKQINKKKLKVGDLVILLESYVAPCHWPMGRIEKLLPGKDDIVRVVTVKCKDKIFTRATNKICLLPIEG